MDAPGASPPEGRLIEQARERKRLSQNKAAKAAGMSGTRWRQVVAGWASGGEGIQIPVHGNAKRIALMAQVVDVTPEQLEEVGREDAARELRELRPSDEPDAEPSLRDVVEQMNALTQEIKEGRARDRERIKQLEDELKRLREQRSG